MCTTVGQRRSSLSLWLLCCRIAHLLVLTEKHNLPPSMLTHCTLCKHALTEWIDPSIIIAAVNTDVPWIMSCNKKRPGLTGSAESSKNHLHQKNWCKKKTKKQKGRQLRHNKQTEIIFQVPVCQRQRYNCLPELGSHFLKVYLPVSHRLKVTGE